MKELFRINTNLFSLVWERTSKCDPPILAQRTQVEGRLKLSPRCDSLAFEGDNWRDVPKQLNDDPTVDAKPPKDEAAKRRSEMKDTFGRELPPLPKKPR